MNKTQLVHSLVILLTLAGMTVAKEPQEDVTTLARRYRIEVYNNFRLDREEYDRRQELGFMALWLHHHVETTDVRTEVESWFRDALIASGGEATELPSLPGQSDHESLEAFADAIEYDERVVKWLTRPVVASAVRQPKRQASNSTPRNQSVPGSVTPIHSQGTHNFQGTDQPKKGLISRMVKAVAFGAASGSSEQPPAEVTEFESVPTFSSDENVSNATPNDVPDDGNVDEPSDKPPADEPQNDEPLTDEHLTDAQWQQHLDQLESLQLAAIGAERMNVKTLQKHTAPLSEWFFYHRLFDAQFAEDARGKELASMRKQGLEVARAFKLRAETLLTESGAQSGTTLKAIHRQLEALVQSAK